ncbi:hypothetical protein DHEL01_v212624 [Diaporthe helianthi]|uniref:Uncharacterized protein n=1 Tax=Diaporthe helianthi TaxID=158607 RepID=A0A2P5HFG9_DIAHE|nr:hypothetical protein DHEL01_v212624 [Diaporthe helianthi]
MGPPRSPLQIDLGMRMGLSSPRRASSCKPTIISALLRLVESVVVAGDLELAIPVPGGDEMPSRGPAGVLEAGRAAHVPLSNYWLLRTWQMVDSTWQMCDGRSAI